MHIAIVTPVYNDWDSLGHLLAALAETLDVLDITASVVAVNDGSTEPMPAAAVLAAKCRGRMDVRVLDLVRNLGHQKAITVGVAHVAAEIPNDGLIVMDADGEDRPEDIGALIEAHRGTGAPIVAARRKRRQESLSFRLGYRIYKLVFQVLCGRDIDFGNFSFVAPSVQRLLTSMPEMWTHYPATLMVSRRPITKIGLDRGARYAGQSKMNFVSLVIHGMRAAALFGDQVITRISVLIAAMFVTGGTFIAVALLFKLFGLATPGWATTLASVGLLVLIQVVLVLLVGLLVLLRDSSENVTRMPSQIAPDLIERVHVVAGGAAKEPRQGALTTV